MPCERCGCRAWAAIPSNQFTEFACVVCGARRYEARAEMPPAGFSVQLRYAGDSDAMADTVLTVRYQHEQRRDGGEHLVVALIACPFCGERMSEEAVSSRTRKKRPNYRRFGCPQEHRLAIDRLKYARKWHWE